MNENEFIPTRRSLLSRLKNWDDQKSWQEFFDTYAKLIYRVAAKAGLADAEAQDVVQETIIIVARKIPGFKYDPAIGSFKTWLLLITRRRIEKQLNKRIPAKVEPVSHLSLASGTPAPRGDDTHRTATVERVVDPKSFDLEAAWDAEWEKNLWDTALTRVKHQVKPKQFQMFDFNSGDVTVKANNSCGSSLPKTLNVTVNNLPPTPGNISGNILICEGSSNAYNISPVAGASSYSWILPSGWTGSSTTNSIAATAGMNSGNISVTANNSCGSSPAKTLSITINNPQEIQGTIIGNAIICPGSLNTYNVTPVSGATNYTWTLPSGWTGASSTNSISTTAGTTGGNISITANNSCGSSPAKTLKVVTNSIPSTPTDISGNTVICAGTSNTYSITPDSGAISYTWTLPSEWTGSSTTNSISTIAGTIGGNISVMANNSCGSSLINNLSITVNNIPLNPEMISGHTIVCSGSSNQYTIPEVSDATSYTWILPSGWTGSSKTNLISTTASNSGGNILVIANNLCGSSEEKILIIAIDSIPQAPAAISGDVILCPGSPGMYTIATVNGAINYTWTLPPGWMGHSTSESINTIAGTLSGDISVTANNTCGSSLPTVLSILAVSIPSNPGTISGKAIVCLGSINTYSISLVSDATSYTWTLPPGWIGTSTSDSITAIASPFSGDISVTANNTCGSSLPTVLSIIADSIPSNPGTISGKAIVCSGSINTYSISAISGATSYTWTLPPGWTGISTSDSITVIAGKISGDISVTANNTCGSSLPAILSVNIDSLPYGVETIFGDSMICPGSSNTYYINSISGATSYTWILPTGWTGASTSATIHTIADTLGGEIAVIANNECGSSPATVLSIIIGSLPPRPDSISGNTLIFPGSLNTYTIMPVKGANSYTWTLPPGWTGTSISDSITTIADTSSGDIIVTANNTCGSSQETLLSITVDTLPQTPETINGDTTICAGSSNIYTISAVSGATNYTWTLPPGWTGSSTTDTILVIPTTTSGEISVTANNVYGSSLSQTLNIIVDSLIPEPGIISGNKTICSGSSNIYSVSQGSGASSYTWNLPNEWTGSSNSDSITAISGAMGGNIVVIGNNSCGSSTESILSVDVDSLPPLPGMISGATIICPGSHNVYSIEPVNGEIIYQWNLPPGWMGSSNSDSITVTADTTGGEISVTVTNSYGCSSTSEILAVTIYNLPNSPGEISGNSVVCSGSTNIYRINAIDGAMSYTWTLPMGWTGFSTSDTIEVIVDTLGGDISVMSNNACGSSQSATLSITIERIPHAPDTIFGNSTICQGSLNTYRIQPIINAISYTWTFPHSWTVSSTLDSVTIIAGARSGNISVTADNACGSSLPNISYVTVDSIPPRPDTIYGSTSIYPGRTNIYSITPVEGATGYTWNLPPGWTGYSSTDTIEVIAGINGGDISVKANNNCGSSVAKTLTVVSNSINTTVSKSGAMLISHSSGLANKWINCNNGYNPIPGQNNQNLITNGTGTYEVILTQSTFADTSSWFNLKLVSQFEKSPGTVLSIFPNPSNGKFQIKLDDFPSLQNSRVEIYNLQGILIYQSVINTSTTAIELNHPETGIYYLKLTTGKATYTRSILIL